MSLGKKIVVGVVIFAVICGGAITLAVLNRKSDPKPLEETSDQETPSSPQPKLDLSLQIKNFSSYPDISDATKTTIKESVNRYLEDIPRTSAPVGVIRDGSYNKTTSGSMSNIVFLLDIASLKRSYKIDLGTDSSTGEQSLYTLCPSSTEAIYPPFDCKDDLSEE